MNRADPSNQRRKIDAEQRRVQVAQLLVSGASQRQIAQTLKVSPATINSDVKILRAAWLKDSIHKVETAIMLDAQRIDRMILALWKEATAKSPDVTKIEAIRKLIETRAKVLNYGAVLLQDDEGKDDETSQAKPVLRFVEVVKSYDEEKS